MKRADIHITFDDYLDALRQGGELQKIEYKKLIDFGLMDAEKANRHWAAFYDLTNMLILAKRASVSVRELEEWIKDASAIRALAVKPDEKQSKLFK